MADRFFTGASTAGLSSSLLSKIRQAAEAVGATGVVITSAKRPPGLQHNDVRRSNHITGDAIDGYAVVDGVRVPIGTALKPVVARFGLRSGDVAGFDPKTPGGFDPIHVDDGANVGMTQPGSAPVFDPAHPDAVASSAVNGALYGDSLVQQIIRSAQKYGVDPAVPLAVAPHEGGFQGAVGDGGHSFGPFQLYSGGKLPGWVFARGSEFAKRWANSPEGIDYAMAGLSKVIGGMSGAPAVVKMVNEFEVPAVQYRQGEIAKSLVSLRDGPVSYSATADKGGTVGAASAAGSAAPTGKSAKHAAVKFAASPSNPWIAIAKSIMDTPVPTVAAPAPHLTIPVPPVQAQVAPTVTAFTPSSPASSVTQAVPKQTVVAAAAPKAADAPVSFGEWLRLR